MLRTYKSRIAGMWAIQTHLCYLLNLSLKTVCSQGRPRSGSHQPFPWAFSYLALAACSEERRAYKLSDALDLQVDLDDLHFGLGGRSRHRHLIQLDVVVE